MKLFQSLFDISFICILVLFYLLNKAALELHNSEKDRYGSCLQGA